MNKPLPSPYAKTDRPPPEPVDETSATVLLAALCQECFSSGHNYHITNAHRDLQTWWNNQQAEKQKKIMEGMKEQRIKNLREQALKKLSPEEQKALGIKG